MKWFPVTLVVVGSTILPIFAFAYLALRLPGRRKQLIDLFTMEKILPHYLVMRGKLPPRQPTEDTRGYLARASKDFKSVLTQDIKQEYGTLRYLPAVLLALITTTTAIYLIVALAAGDSPWPRDVPNAVPLALLAAFLAAVATMIQRYSAANLTPVTFYRITLRYALACAYAVLASVLLKSDAVAALLAFVLALLPVEDGLRAIREWATRYASPIPLPDAYDRLSVLQGLDPSTIERFGELGVHTPQQLALSDPLDLLLRSNFTPKVLIDWMDQALLYNYAGSAIEKLRPRGIRGAIELGDLVPDTD